MKQQFLIAEQKEEILQLRLNRPDQGNALSMALRDEIEQTLAIAEKDDNIRAVVLLGGEKFFCFGFDLAEVIRTRLDSFRHRFFEYHHQIYSFRKPLVVAVQGFATGGGFDLSQAGDHIIAAEKSLFGRPEAKFGAPPLMLPLLRRMPMQRAKQISFSQDFYNSKKALELGIIDQIVPAEDLLSAALKMAKKLARNEPQMIAAVKDICYSNMGLTALMKKETEVTFAFLDNPKALEIVTHYYQSLTGTKPE